jgi:hypothetical protein
MMLGTVGYCESLVHFYQTKRSLIRENINLLDKVDALSEAKVEATLGGAAGAQL